MSLDQQIRDRLPFDCAITDQNRHIDALGDALRAVLDLHRPHHIYEHCGHWHLEGAPGVHDVENVGLVCDDGYEYSICRACCTGGSGYQTEDCVEYHPASCWPCSTVRAAARALGIGGDDQ